MEGMPAFYNKTNPCQYDNLTGVKHLSMRERPLGGIIHPNTISNYGVVIKSMRKQSEVRVNDVFSNSQDNIFVKSLPKHRFTDYSVANQNANILEK